jgi:hypothetical protein
MLWVTPGHCPELAFGTIDVLPVIAEDQAEVVVCIDKLWILLQHLSEQMLRLRKQPILHTAFRHPLSSDK